LLHRAKPYQYGHPFKDPIRNYQKYLEDRKLKQQKAITKKYKHIDNWINNKEIDLEDFYNFWNNKFITNSQITQLPKFQTRQSMGNARKHIFYPTIFPNINYTLCHIQSIDTWPHLLLACPDLNIHKLRIKRHKNVV
jgi:hypothetical protein